MYFFSIIALFVFSVFVILLVYEDRIKSEIIGNLNKHLNTPVHVLPRNIQLTFFRTFPKTTLRFSDVVVMGSHPEHTDTLMKIQRISFYFSFWSVWGERICIESISARGVEIYALRRKDGVENWNFLKDERKTSRGNPQNQNDFSIEEIVLKNVKLKYISKPDKIQHEQKMENIRISFHSISGKTLLGAKGEGKIISFKNKDITCLKNMPYSFEAQIESFGNDYNLKKVKFSFADAHFGVEGLLKYDTVLRKASLRFQAENLRLEDAMKAWGYTDGNLPRTNDPLRIYGMWNTEGKRWEFRMNFEGRELNIRHASWHAELERVNMKGGYHTGSDLTGVLRIEKLEGLWNHKPFAASAEVKDFQKPHIQIQYEGNVPVMLFTAFNGMDSLLDCRGDLQARWNLFCDAAQFRSAKWLPGTKMELGLRPEGLTIMHKPTKKRWEIDSALIEAENEKVRIHYLTLKMGKNEFRLSGEWKNFFGYVFGESSLEIWGMMHVRSWDVASWLEDVKVWSTISTTSSGTKTTDKATRGYRADVRVKADTILFSSFFARNVDMHLEWKDEQVFAEELFMECLGGKFSGGVKVGMNAAGYEVMSEGKIQNIHLEDAFRAFRQFGQQTITDKHLQGIMDGNYTFKGRWNSKFECDAGSIQCQAEYTLRNGRLKNYEPLKKLSGFLDVELLGDIRFDDIVGQIYVQKESIRFPRTDIRNSALNLTLEGEHTFENVLDYRIRISLSELLSKKSRYREEFMPDEQNRRKVFLRLYGPMDNLKYAFDKQGWKEKVKEDFALQKTELKKIFQEEFRGKKDTAGKAQKMLWELEEKDAGKEENKSKDMRKKKQYEEEEDY